MFFVRNRKVFAQPFDAASGKLSGAATPLADADSYSLAGPSVFNLFRSRRACNGLRRVEMPAVQSDR